VGNRERIQRVFLVRVDVPVRRRHTGNVVLALAFMLTHVLLPLALLVDCIKESSHCIVNAKPSMLCDAEEVSGSFN
jgi:hypothetical protein